MCFRSTRPMRGGARKGTSALPSAGVLVRIAVKRYRNAGRSEEKQVSQVSPLF